MWLRLFYCLVTSLTHQSGNVTHNGTQFCYVRNGTHDSTIPTTMVFCKSQAEGAGLDWWSRNPKRTGPSLPNWCSLASLALQAIKTLKFTLNRRGRQPMTKERKVTWLKICGPSVSYSPEYSHGNICRCVPPTCDFFQKLKGDLTA